MFKLNGNPVNVTLFPDKTSQVWHILSDSFKEGYNANIEWDYLYEGEVMHLIQLVYLVKALGSPTVRLHMNYLPYARQDKVSSDTSTFALYPFIKILNDLELDSVTALDVHSDVPKHLINNFRNVAPWWAVTKTVIEVKPDVLAFPDKGAKDRYSRDLSFLNKIHVFGDKTRDQETGHITKYELSGDVADQNVLMVDDICDGGMTFILLAKELLTKGAKSVSLYTTHGIYSKGLKPLREAKIDRIFNKDGEVSELLDAIVVSKFK